MVNKHTADAARETARVVEMSHCLTCFAQTHHITSTCVTPTCTDISRMYEALPRHWTSCQQINSTVSQATGRSTGQLIDWMIQGLVNWLAVSWCQQIVWLQEKTKLVLRSHEYQITKQDLNSLKKQC